MGTSPNVTSLGTAPPGSRRSSIGCLPATTSIPVFVVSPSPDEKKKGRVMFGSRACVPSDKSTSSSAAAVAARRKGTSTLRAFAKNRRHAT